MSLYGIETEADCEEKIKELLDLVACAEHALKGDTAAAKRTIYTLKQRLKELFRKGTRANQACMSAVEATRFRPAVKTAYLSAPKLSAPYSWSKGLQEVRNKLASPAPNLGSQEEKGGSA